jgi:MGT family glycosyltransferase
LDALVAPEVLMRVLFTTVPGVGHLLPLVPLVRALTSDGHDVRIATSASFASRLEHLRVPVVPAGLDWLESEPERIAVDAEVTDLGRAARISWIFRAAAPEPMARDLLTLAQRWRPDIVLFDNVERGGLLFAETTDTPYAFIAHDTFLPPGWGPGSEPDARAAFRRRRGLDVYDRTRAALGLEPDLDERKAFSELVLLMMPRVLWTVPPQWVFGHDVTLVRPEPVDVMSSTSSTLPDWITDRSRPVAAVTLGTVFSDAPDTINVAVEGLRAAGYRVLVGGADSDSDDGQVATRRWAPMATLAASVDLVVTHGGMGTVTAALCSGRPLIVIPQALDHPLTGLRIAAAGLGEIVAPQDLTAATLRACAEKAASGEFDAAVARVAANIAAMPAADSIVSRIVAHAEALHSQAADTRQRS